MKATGRESRISVRPRSCATSVSQSICTATIAAGSPSRAMASSTTWPPAGAIPNTIPRLNHENRMRASYGASIHKRSSERKSRDSIIPPAWPTMFPEAQWTTTAIYFSATLETIRPASSRSRCRPTASARTPTFLFGCGVKGGTMQAKSRFDPNSPEIKAYQNELAHQFVREGTMVAFPTCRPGMTPPITHDESRITALDINSEGHVYGGTSGRQAHLFGAAFHGLTGIALDAGAVPAATSTEGACCGASGRN